MSLENNSISHKQFTIDWTKAQPTISAYIYSSVRDRHAAEDLLQTVATTAFEKIETFDPQKKFTPWIMGIAKNKILEYYRKTANAKVHFSQETLNAIGCALQEIKPEENPRSQALSQCLDAIHIRGRKVLELRYVQNKSVNNIAKHINTTQNAISVLLYKLRIALGKCIEQKLSNEQK